MRLTSAQAAWLGALLSEERANTVEITQERTYESIQVTTYAPDGVRAWRIEPDESPPSNT